MSERVVTNSEAAFIRAKEVMPGGVSSPVRAFKGVGGNPIFIKEGKDCWVTDLDGNKYIDYVASYGPLIAGHCNERVVAALSKAIGKGTSFGAPTEGEVQLAGAIVAAMPAVEMVRFVNSGTEAVMSAVRLARAVTGRERVVKCIGSYHGHVDGMLVQAGSGALTLGTPSSPGVPKAITDLTLLVPYNDLEAAKALFKRHKKEIACFVAEPVAGNMGVVPPAEGYLQGLRELCDREGSLLMFDEVMTGFRVAWSGAQGRYHVRPDITCLGKVIGGGLPVGAFGGAKAIMEQVSPAGPVYQAGTLSGNPLAMAGGMATLDILKEPGVYETLEARSAALAAGLEKAAGEAGVPMVVNRVGSMLTPFFVKGRQSHVRDFEEATGGAADRYATFFHGMLDNGVYLAPSQYEAMFVGCAHTEEVIELTLSAARKSLSLLKK